MKITNTSKNIQGIEGVDGIVYINPGKSCDVELSEYSKSKDFSGIFLIEKKNFFPKSNVFISDGKVSNTFISDGKVSNIRVIEQKLSQVKPEKKKRGRPPKKVSE